MCYTAGMIKPYVFDITFLRRKFPHNPAILVRLDLLSRFVSLQETRGDILQCPLGHMADYTPEEMDEELAEFMFNFAKAAGVDLRFYSLRDASVWRIKKSGAWVKAYR